MEKRFGYLVAIIDCYSRKVLNWRLFHTMGTDFCVQALDAAIQIHGCPWIMNTDQGILFASAAFIEVL